MNQNTSAPKATRREWIGLAVLALPCLLYSMDLTVLLLAVPQLTTDLAPTAAQLLWIVDIYGFMVAGFLVTMGTLGDRIGRRRILLIGSVAFGCASVLAAFSSSAEMLIISRALLGIAAATLAPSTLSLIRNMFLDPQQRTVAIGIWIASFSAGAALGPLIGGMLIAYFWWGSVFLVAVPVMVLLLVLGPTLLPEYRDPQAGRIDLISAILSLIAVLAVIYGLKYIATVGLEWAPILTILAGLFVGALFVRRQSRLDDPLIDLRLFHKLAFSASVVANLLGVFIAFGTFLFVAQYFQLVLGMGPFEAGLWTAPSGLAFIAGSMLAPVILRRIRAVHVMAGGFGLSAIGLILLANIGGAEGPWLVVAGYLLLCLGLAPVGTLTTDLIVGLAPPERAGAASAISETSAEFGGALGIAVLGSIVTAGYRVVMVDGVPPEVPPQLATAARDTLGGAVIAAERLPADTGAALLETARAAFTQSMELTSAICAATAVAAALLAMIVLQRQGQRA